MRINWGRWILSLLIIVVVNELAQRFLIRLGITDILIFVILIDLIMAFTIALINYPWFIRKDFLRDLNFHKTFMILFFVLFAIDFFRLGLF